MGTKPSDEPDPIIKLGITAINSTAFFWLLTLGYPAEQAIAIAVAIALGAAAVLDRFRRGGGTGGGGQR